MPIKAQNGQTAQSEPFTMFPLWLHRSQKLSLYAKVLLVILANYENLGITDPSIEDLGKATALSEPTIKRAVAELVRCRIIQRIRGQRGNSYKLAARSEWREIIPRDPIDPPETHPEGSNRSLRTDPIDPPESAVLITKEELLKKKKNSLFLSHRKHVAKRGISPTKKPSAESVALAVQPSLIPEPRAETFEAWFEEKFWPFYPRKVGKAAALTAARRAAGKSAKVRDEILAGLYAQLPNFESREPEFVPHCSTWLNHKRWNDEPEPARRPPESERDRNFRIAAADFLKEPSR